MTSMGYLIDQIQKRIKPKKKLKIRRVRKNKLHELPRAN